MHAGLWSKQSGGPFCHLSKALYAWAISQKAQNPMISFMLQLMPAG